MKLVMITGFLGAGKTTLLREILGATKEWKLGLIINEFGEINVDGQLVEQEGIQMAELTNGSIFCACIKDKFVDSLIEMTYRDLDAVFIEATGLADPSSMPQILSGISRKVRAPYDYLGSVCVVDAETFMDLYDLLPAVSAQLEYCSGVIVNKADRVGTEALAGVLDQIHQVNPGITPIITSYCKVDVTGLLEGLDPMSAARTEPRESSNTPVSRPQTFIVKGGAGLPYDRLRTFLEEVSPQAYRLKGFAATDRGPYEVSCVRGTIEMKQWPQPLEETGLVVISAVGFGMMSLLIKTIETQLKGQLWI